jgi:hypothetical protein
MKDLNLFTVFWDYCWFPLYLLIGVGIVAGIFKILEFYNVVSTLKLDQAKALIWAIVPTPKNIMRLYAGSQDTLHSFTATHYLQAFLFFSLSALIGYVAYSADWEVLYGMRYTISRDHAYSWQFATLWASIIQFAIFFTGGKVIQLWLHDKHKEESHKWLFIIQLVIFIVALAATLFLSYKSYYAAKSKGIQGKDKIEDLHKIEMVH